MTWLLLLAVLATGPVSEEAGEEANEPAPGETVEEEIEVVGVTPLDGRGIPADRVPVPVQSADAGDLERAVSLDLTDFLTRHFAGVHVEDVQNNPFQPDLRFRGFTASPLLGSSQGLAVYQDGVRLNEPFGDLVSWDLIPRMAIGGVELVPGSSPLFGFNAVGGALSIRTKSGFSHPRHRLRLGGGSFGRATADFESGGHGERLSHYVSGTAFTEDGWRDFSPSDVRQLFGRFDWRGRRTTAALSVTAADNELRGNGALPVQLLAVDRDAVFTHPDVTENRLFAPTLELAHQLSPDLLLEAVFHYRGSDADTFNGDDRDDGDDDAEGDEGEDDEDDQDDEDEDDPFNATNNTSSTDRRSYGGSLQGSYRYRFGDRPGRLVVGTGFELRRAAFNSATELATLTPSRGTVGSGVFDPDAFVDVGSRGRRFDLYATTTFDPTDRLTLHLSARYDRTTIELRDNLGTELDGDHAFDRLNPAVGASYRLGRRLTIHASYGESSRAPTPVELTCADPEDPCRLPNAFVADPPLEQVVTRGWEAGLRGLGATRWHLTLFRATSDDDLIFISSGALTNAGHFDNVGRTRRQGVELGVSGELGPRLRGFLSYTLVEATFETPLTLPSPQHPLAEDGEIPVEPGDRLPGVPRHNLKLGLDLAPVDRLRVGATLLASSERFYRGDEANLLEPIPGFAVVDLQGSYRLAERFSLSFRLRNLFDEEYETFGLFGEADDVLGDDFDDPRFLAPGAPRSLHLFLEIELGSSSP